MNKSNILSKITEKKETIINRINKLEKFIFEENTPNIAKKVFEINLRYLREEYKKLEIQETLVKGGILK